ncbi:hypothetical protein TRICI_003668 [Trichomonascus ciferrii]|uniref:Uncharacterized protein n=1 Tax=Trichomonascus ciferrii TaxID=44093 RepID=A0A642V2Q5_9ASCO|nr:hypothetical protein TRICI_003668 [Trichomonascus ciferrii]
MNNTTSLSEVFRSGKHADVFRVLAYFPGGFIEEENSTRAYGTDYSSFIDEFRRIELGLSGKTNDRDGLIRFIFYNETADVCSEATRELGEVLVSFVGKLNISARKKAVSIDVRDPEGIRRPNSDEVAELLKRIEGQRVDRRVIDALGRIQGMVPAAPPPPPPPHLDVPRAFVRLKMYPTRQYQYRSIGDLRRMDAVVLDEGYFVVCGTLVKCQNRPRSERRVQLTLEDHDERVTVEFWVDDLYREQEEPETAFYSLQQNQNRLIKVCINGYSAEEGLFSGCDTELQFTSKAPETVYDGPLRRNRRPREGCIRPVFDKERKYTCRTIYEMNTFTDPSELHGNQFFIVPGYLSNFHLRKTPYRRVTLVLRDEENRTIDVDFPADQFLPMQHDLVKKTVPALQSNQDHIITLCIQSKTSSAFLGCDTYLVI